MTWQAKLQRAKRHYAELEENLANYFATQPYKISTRRGVDGKLVYYLSEVAEIPADLPCITGDIIQNLRSALDHLAYDLWMSESNGSGRDGKIYFPVDKDKASYNRSKTKKTQGISARSLKIIDSLQPYKGGNDVLWQINSLNNRDKHRLLVTVGSSFRSLDLGAEMFRTMKRMSETSGEPLPDLRPPPLFLKPADSLFPLEVGKELFIGAEDAEENPDMQFRFNILLHEPGVIDGELITEVLTSMTAEVEKIGLLLS